NGVGDGVTDQAVQHLVVDGDVRLRRRTVRGEAALNPGTDRAVYAVHIHADRVGIRLERPLDGRLHLLRVHEDTDVGGVLVGGGVQPFLDGGQHAGPNPCAGMGRNVDHAQFQKFLPVV